MKRKINYIIALLTGAIIVGLSGCSVEETLPLYGPDGKILKNPGRVKIAGEAGDKVAGKSLMIVDSNNTDVVAIGNNEWVDLEAGTYSLVGFTGTEYFNRTGTLITLKGTTRAQLPTLPDGMRGGAEAFTVSEDQIADGKVTFKPLTRKLRIEGELDGISPYNITDMMASLSGLAGGIDLSKGFGGVVTSSASNTAQLEVSVVDGKLVMVINLLGIDAALDQVFTIEITTVDGKKYTLTMSLKDVLAGFNTGSSDMVFTVNIRLVADSESNFSGTIIDWEEGEDVDIPGEG